MDVEQLKQDVRDGRVSLDRLVDVIDALLRQLAEARQEIEQGRRRIEELEKKLGGAASVKVDESYSMKAEAKRQEARRGKSKRKRKPLD